MTRFRSVGIVALVLALAALAAYVLIDKPQPSSQVPVSQVPVKVADSPGEQVYIKWCAECHASAIGPGTQVLEKKYMGQVPAILHLRTGIPAELVTVSVRHGVGFMAPFRKTEISDSELASLATYLSTAK
jgi:mono/diheme cytochrome c family protein